MTTIARSQSNSNTTSTLFALALGVIALIGFAIYFCAPAMREPMVTRQIDLTTQGAADQGIPAPPMPIPTTAQ